MCQTTVVITARLSSVQCSEGQFALCQAQAGVVLQWLWYLEAPSLESQALWVPLGPLHSGRLYGSCLLRPQRRARPYPQSHLRSRGL